MKMYNPVLIVKQRQNTGLYYLQTLKNIFLNLCNFKAIKHNFQSFGLMFYIPVNNLLVMLR